MKMIFYVYILYTKKKRVENFYINNHIIFYTVTIKDKQQFGEGLLVAYINEEIYYIIMRNLNTVIMLINLTYSVNDFSPPKKIRNLPFKTE